MPVLSLDSDALRRIRRERGLSQRQLAELIRSTSVEVSKWDRGVRPVQLATVGRLAIALEVHPMDLLTWAGGVE
ncbi:DNA-binding Xre family transcriptional regulator [Haloactinospora alba]|uniref:DNA-binding Xre family transcriptional regulator n=1 Tax=Haloactinospora alba TaxID=405555 RepID=A0A543NG27_9ACTN|nr:helix-turn-helix transcriptional regulator [Haloactinospora alba]TQN30741.1 DNA-binding Xre family transcriptional regulator [Haloactinospora alba]